MLASGLQIVGLIVFCIALALWIPILGLAAAGIALFAAGIAVEG